jgi:hypothetical protein
MIEDGQIDLAWPLFQNMNELALDRGVVGGLPETMDAYPHPGETWPRLTGAFLQAWSNAEQLRVWYQYVLGIRPEMLKQEILLAPRLPSKLGAAGFSVSVGAGSLHGTFDRVAGHRRYVYRLANQAQDSRWIFCPTRPRRSRPRRETHSSLRFERTEFTCASSRPAARPRRTPSCLRRRLGTVNRRSSMPHSEEHSSRKLPPLGSHPVLKRVASKSDRSLQETNSSESRLYLCRDCPQIQSPAA